MLSAIKKLMGIGVIVLSAINSCQANEPVAVITDMKGVATITENGKSQKLQLMAYLMPGAEIRVEPGARLVVTDCIKPRDLEIAGPAKLLIDQNGPKVLTGSVATERSLTGIQLTVAKNFTAMQRERLTLAAFEMRANSSPVRLLGPDKTKVINTTQEFLWHGPERVNEYHFVLSDARGGVIQDVKTRQPAFHLADTQLKRGKVYRWKVEAQLPDGERVSAIGRFSVLPDSKAQQILAARPQPDASFTDRVLYVAMMELEGLKYEARTEWQALSSERPDDLFLKKMAIADDQSGK